jgi:hypothetical protein
MSDAVNKVWGELIQQLSDDYGADELATTEQVLSAALYQLRRGYRISSLLAEVPELARETDDLLREVRRVLEKAQEIAERTRALDEDIDKAWRGET